MNWCQALNQFKKKINKFLHVRNEPITKVGNLVPITSIRPRSDGISALSSLRPAARYSCLFKIFICSFILWSFVFSLFSNIFNCFFRHFCRCLCLYIYGKKPFNSLFYIIHYGSLKDTFCQLDPLPKCILSSWVYTAVEVEKFSCLPTLVVSLTYYTVQ